MSQAIFVHAHGGPEAMRFESHDPGPPGPGTVRVRVAAAGVNFIDVYIRTGLYARPVPLVLGQEGAGTVEAVGPDTTLGVGDRVAWATVLGSYANIILAPEAQLVRIPDAVSDEQAAAALLQGMTAHYLVHSTRVTRSGDVALVHAAAGGVGLLLVQTLKAAGVTVFGTCSTSQKADLVRDAGADAVILYGQEDFVEEVRRATDGRGVDVVYDSVGQATAEGSLRSLRPRGLFVAFGQSSGPIPPFDLLRLSQLGSLFATRPTLGHYIADRAELDLRARAVLEAVAIGTLRLHIGARFPLAQVADAHRALEARQTTGKVILVP